MWTKVKQRDKKKKRGQKTRRGEIATIDDVSCLFVSQSIAFNLAGGSQFLFFALC